MVGSNCAFMENICSLLSHLWWHIYLTTCMMNYFNMWLIYIIMQYQPIYLWFFKHAKKTGVGPQPKLPSAVEWKIIDLMKDRPNFSGIIGGFWIVNALNIKYYNIFNFKNHALKKHWMKHSICFNILTLLADNYIW